MDFFIDASKLKLLGDVYQKFPPSSVTDFITDGQLRSKLWLLQNISQHLGNRFQCVFVLAGWHGLLSYLMLACGRFEIGKIRSFDIDPECELIADTLNRHWVSNNWQFKACTMDIVQLNYQCARYIVHRANGSQCQLEDRPDLVVNTSCEHIANLEEWWDKIPLGSSVALQSSDAESIPGHISCVNDLGEFAKLLPMQNKIFGGELDLGSSKRFMLIGRK